MNVFPAVTTRVGFLSHSTVAYIKCSGSGDQICGTFVIFKQIDTRAQHSSSLTDRERYGLYVYREYAHSLAYMQFLSTRICSSERTGNNILLS